MSESTSLGTFFQELQNEQVNGVTYKNVLLKKQILDVFVHFGNSTIADLGKHLNVSIPKINELISDLIKDGLVRDFGKISSGVGRRPNIYGLEASSAHFIGVEVKRKYVNIGLMDFSENFIEMKENIPFQLSNDKNSLDSLCLIIEDFIAGSKVKKEKILGIGVNITGRVNHKTGYSYSFFNFDEEPVSKTIERHLGIQTYIENDSRAMAYGEFYSGAVSNEKDVLFINIDEGIGMGIMIDGNLYYGKSGFAGEFGHIPWLSNNIICHCGKKGCLETEASGMAITKTFIQKIEEGSTSIVTTKIKNPSEIKLEDIIQAALNDDMLAIELIAEAGEKIGRGIASLINLFNPELVILGGSLAETEAYIRLPIKYAINKYSLSLVNTDTHLTMSKLGKKAGVVGACLLVRNKILSIH